MATVIGQSGAWHSIVREAARLGHAITSPEDVAPLAARLREGRQVAVDAHMAESTHSAQALSAEIVRLHDSRGSLMRYLNRNKVRILRNRLAAVEAADRWFIANLDQKIHRIESIPDSAEMAGARAELEVIEHLRLLPETFIVFNDVQLEADKSMLYEHEWLKTAQVDHLVIGPTGVFTIETKCWSRATAESGHHHNPFDQADRAGHLCYVLLLSAFGHTKVRSVIAGMGSLPTPPRNTMVRAVPPRDLRALIEGYARGKQELSAGQVQRLRPFFERRVVTART